MAPPSCAEAATIWPLTHWVSSARLWTWYKHSKLCLWDTAVLLYVMYVAFFYWTVFHCMNIPQFTYFTVGHLGCLQYLAITCGVTTNVLVRLWCTCIHISLGNIPRSRTAGLQGMFSFRRYWQVALQSGFTNLHFHPKCMKIPIVPPLCQHLVFLAFSISATLIGKQWHFIVLIWHSIMTKGLDQLFVHLLVLRISSFVEQMPVHIWPL